jgi:hypothetical protein
MHGCLVTFIFSLYTINHVCVLQKEKLSDRLTIITMSTLSPRRPQLPDLAVGPVEPSPPEPHCHFLGPTTVCPKSLSQSCCRFHRAHARVIPTSPCRSCLTNLGVIRTTVPASPISVASPLSPWHPDLIHCRSSRPPITRHPRHYQRLVGRWEYPTLKSWLRHCHIVTKTVKLKNRASGGSCWWHFFLISWHSYSPLLINLLMWYDI